MLDEINSDSKKILIINAGSMNHGKSSLFNSLLDKSVFAENDIRETLVMSEDVPWLEDVFLVDTPGLNAEDTDDAEAYKAYKRANMVIFVHTVKAGELKERELNAINLIKNVLGEKYFWEHFCLALTFLDAESESGVNVILDKCLVDISNFCGGKDFPVFLISNSRYKKGSAENKTVLIEKSGILQLRTYLKHHISKWRDENRELRRQKIQRAKQELMSEINAEHERLQNKITRKTAAIESRQRDFLYKVQSAVDNYYYDRRQLKNAQSRLNSARSELESLRNRHKQDLARY